MTQNQSPLITSPQNPLVKSIVRLRNRRHRERENVLVIEGRAEVRRAIENGVRITELVLCEEILGETAEHDWLKREVMDGQRIVNASSRVFEKLAYRQNPDGVLALAIPPNWSLSEFKTSEIPLIVVVVGVEKPGNLGSILRCADAAGIDGVIVCDPETDPANPNVIRASLGTVFSVQLAQADTQEAIDWLRNRNINILAAAPDAVSKYDEMDLGEPTAFVLGAEHSGLSLQWTQAATERIHIPMRGQIDSLNVAVATGILLFEARRQRE